MNLCMNLGTWNAIFAVPCEVIDKHIKLAGGAQLKVLLFMLRHAGEKLSLAKIAVALSMTELDVKDSMQYWIETNILTGLKEPGAPETTALPTAMSPITIKKLNLSVNLLAWKNQIPHPSRSE